MTPITTPWHLPVPLKEQLVITPQKGFSLIEVLTALLVLAVGLLGQMALQVTSISSNQSSYYRSQAAILANDFADRMRLNPSAVSNGTYDAVVVGFSEGAPNGSIGDGPDCSAAACSIAEVAALDIAELENNLLAAIPSGVATVTRTATNVITTTTNEARFQIDFSWSMEDQAGLPNADAINQVSFEIGIGI